MKDKSCFSFDDHLVFSSSFLPLSSVFLYKLPHLLVLYISFIPELEVLGILDCFLFSRRASRASVSHRAACIEHGVCCVKEDTCRNAQVGPCSLKCLCESHVCASLQLFRAAKVKQALLSHRDVCWI